MKSDRHEGRRARVISFVIRAAPVLAENGRKHSGLSTDSERRRLKCKSRSADVEIFYTRRVRCAAYAPKSARGASVLTLAPRKLVRTYVHVLSYTLFSLHIFAPFIFYRSLPTAPYARCSAAGFRRCEREKVHDDADVRHTSTCCSFYAASKMTLVFARASLILQSSLRGRICFSRRSVRCELVVQHSP